MPVSVSDLREAKPQQWRDAADDIARAAKKCGQMASFAGDEVAKTLGQCWKGDTGESARRRFVKHAEDFSAAKEVLQSLVKVYDTLADEIEGAQSSLESVLDYARKHDLKIQESGRVQLDHPVASKPGSDSHMEPVDHAQMLVDEALNRANKADVEAARDLRTIAGLTNVSDVALIRQALEDDSPLALALRLNQGRGDIHPINVSQSQLRAVENAARETGISKKLLLSILWQEQQWYQNIDPGLNGPASWVGRFTNQIFQETIKPDKSLGITHIKPDTARQVLRAHPEQFTHNGAPLSRMDDSQLSRYIEEHPNDAIRMSAYHLRDLRANGYGGGTDKALFTLYAADTPDVREKNEAYGDESDMRGGDIKARGRNWDRISPYIDDAMAWERLTEKERAAAVRQLEAQTPAGHHISLDPIYAAGGPTTGTGTGAPKPGTPAPSPGPSPTPPAH
ncbi:MULTISPECIES: hypothetical protein [Streptomyces]|uniref:Uncharacterized protein n=2 Tax=Streptomyces TaxID=1883 RepID=A0A6C1C7M4_9ACTN|nr:MULTISPECIES: hypothetical protein [Streptomyces]QID38360.1 hypothetical protein G3260_004985 [Streptomyces albus]TGG78147.1 hypothetical protein D8771_26245 [Streptomyces albus]UVN54647.1 hypothetical protein NR995_08995 [Streptomyces albus]GHJ24693.1 hypothetical protein TPA0909_63070 [Streptomyces albus]